MCQFRQTLKNAPTSGCTTKTSMMVHRGSRVCVRFCVCIDIIRAEHVCKRVVWHTTLKKLTVGTVENCNFLKRTEIWFEIHIFLKKTSK